VGYVIVYRRNTAKRVMLRICANTGPSIVIFQKMHVYVLIVVPMPIPTVDEDS
jgi:hypothetical protein